MKNLVSKKLNFLEFESFGFENILFYSITALTFKLKICLGTGFQNSPKTFGTREIAKING